MSSLPLKTQACLDWIEEYIAQRQTSPSYHQIAQGLGYKSVSAVQHHLRRLEKAGFIARDPGQARSIRLLRASPTGIPICGAIAAGSLVEFFPDHEISCIPFALFPQKSQGLDRFALRVRGDSMINAHILDKDIVVLEKPFDAKEIKDGAIVAARVDSENRATLKRWRRVGSQVFLVPENDNYSMIQIEAENVFVEGIYVGLVRGLV